MEEDGRDEEDVPIRGDDLARLVDLLSQAIAQAAVAVDLVRRALGVAPGSVVPGGVARGGTPRDGVARVQAGRSEVAVDEARAAHGGVAHERTRGPASCSSSRAPWTPPSPTPAKHSREVHRALRYIEAHYEEVISLARLARVADCGRRHLAGAFRRETGETIHSYLMRVRLTRAALHVRAGDKIEAVMLGVGYRGKRNFYRQFKAQFGETPTAYRQRQLAGDTVALESSPVNPSGELASEGQSQHEERVDAITKGGTL